MSGVLLGGPVGPPLPLCVGPDDGLPANHPPGPHCIQGSGCTGTVVIYESGPPQSSNFHRPLWSGLQWRCMDDKPCLPSCLNFCMGQLVQISSPRRQLPFVFLLPTWKQGGRHLHRNSLPEVLRPRQTPPDRPLHLPLSPLIPSHRGPRPPPS